MGEDTFRRTDAITSSPPQDRLTSGRSTSRPRPAAVTADQPAPLPAVPASPLRAVDAFSSAAQTTNDWSEPPRRVSSHQVRLPPHGVHLCSHAARRRRRSGCSSPPSSSSSSSSSSGRRGPAPPPGLTHSHTAKFPSDIRNLLPLVC